MRRWPIVYVALGLPLIGGYALLDEPLLTASLASLLVADVLSALNSAAGDVPALEGSAS